MERTENGTEPIRLSTPLTKDKVRSLHIGDRVLLSGTIYAARDAAHKRMVEALDNGESLPVNLANQIIYYVGPSPAKPGHVIGAAGPTTSGRMDRYTPRLLEQGLLGMIGKGNRSQAVLAAMQTHGAVYFAALGGAGALLSRCIRGYTVLAYPELGPEALAALQVEAFPVIVVGDCEGHDFYVEGPRAFCF
ncbi:MAG: Fe-S-containing hydro-lyase [Bilophila sp.]